MNIKLLVSSLPAIGKTSLLSTLQDTLVISRDGKKYPFPQPHVNVHDFTSVDELIEIVVNTVNSYNSKFGELPKTVAFDSISKIFLDIEGYVTDTVKSFPYTKVNSEIREFVNFIEQTMLPEFNVVMVSHAMWNEDTASYSLVNAGGAFGKKGGMLSEVDEAIFLKLQGNKRTVHFRNSKFLSRTTCSELPEKMSIEDFSLQEHLDILQKKQSEAAEWEL